MTQQILELDAPFVRSLHERLARLFGGQVPAVELSSGERMARSGHLFAQAVPFVRSVAIALRERPADYADIAIEPDLLDARQDRALAFLLLHSGLQMLADRCYDCYLMDQSDCVTDAMAAVNQVRSDADRPFPPENAWAREQGMAAPEAILQERQEQKKRKARSNKAKAGRPARPRTPPQRRAAEAYERAQAEELLDSFIRRIRPVARPPAGPATPPVPDLHTEAGPPTPDPGPGDIPQPNLDRVDDTQKIVEAGDGAGPSGPGAPAGRGGPRVRGADRQRGGATGGAGGARRADGGDEAVRGERDADEEAGGGAAGRAEAGAGPAPRIGKRP
jgi:hypothetical protein